MIEQNNDVTASALEYFRRKQQWHDESDMREAAMYDDIAAQSARDDAAEAWIKSQAAGDTLPGRDQFDYAQMLADGVTPGRDDTGAIPLPPRYFRGVYAGGVDLGTRARILNDAPQIEDEFEAAVLALDDPETDPRVHRSVAAWLKSQGVEGVDDAYFGDPIRVAANGPAVGAMSRRDTPVHDGPVPEPVPTISTWDAGARGEREDAVKQLLLRFGVDERHATQMASNLISGTGTPLGIGAADFDPTVLAPEMVAAMERGDYLDAFLSALGLAPFAKPAAKVAGKAIKAAPKATVVAGGAAAMGASGDAEASWLSFLSGAGKITKHMSQAGIIKAAKSQGAIRVSEKTADNVLKALKGELEPVSVKVGPVTVTEGNGLNNGYYYMAANEDRVVEVMRTLGLKPTNDPTDNLDAVLKRWGSSRSRTEYDERSKMTRVYFGQTNHGQRVTGLVLDKNNEPMTMFTMIYSYPKKK